MSIRFFERATLAFGVMGYVLMFAGYAAVKGVIPESAFKLENVSWSLAVCAILLLACEIMACGTFQLKDMWMKSVTFVLLFYMFVFYQIPLVVYIAIGQAGWLSIFIKVVVPILTTVMFLFVALYVTRQRRRLVYV